MKRGQICPTYAKAREDIKLVESEESFFHGVKPAKTFACNKCCLLKKAREIIGVSAGKAATGRKAGKSSIGKTAKENVEDRRENWQNPSQLCTARTNSSVGDQKSG